jgi:hypothetical protein
MHGKSGKCLATLLILICQTCTICQGARVADQAHVCTNGKCLWPLIRIYQIGHLLNIHGHLSGQFIGPRTQQDMPSLLLTWPVLVKSVLGLYL